MYIDSFYKGITGDISHTPIEQLLKAIISLEQEESEDFTDIINEMKKKLEPYLDKYEVQKGKVYKKIDDIKYYPNGLLEWDQKSYRFVTLLSGYNFDFPESKRLKKDRKPSIKPRYEQIKHISLFWYYQVKEYIGSKYVVNDYNTVNINDILFMSKYSNLNKEIREQVDNCLLQNATSNINPHLRNLFICTGAGYNYNKNEEYQKYLFSYLTSKELETVVNICKAGMNVEDTYDKLYKFANEKFNNPDYSVISFNHTFTNPYYKSSNVNDAISLCCNIIKCLFNIKEINGRKALVKLGVLEDSKLTDDVINHVSEPAVLTSKDIEHLLTLKYYYY